MPPNNRGLRNADPRSRGMLIGPRRRGKTTACCKLDSSLPLIAPPHSFRLPSLSRIKTKYQVSYGADNALPLARALIVKGKLAPYHFENCQAVAGVLQNALSEAVTTACPASEDRFDVEIRISDNLDERESRRDCLFFSWGNTGDPQYIPLRPIFEKLAGNPYQEPLMASLYRWLHQAAWQVFCAWATAKPNAYTAGVKKRISRLANPAKMSIWKAKWNPLTPKKSSDTSARAPSWR